MTLLTPARERTTPLLDLTVPGDRPRYALIVENLIQRVAAKEWKPGDSLPSESSLASEYGVSNGTMRKAIEQMVGQRLLVRHQGKGTFVATHDVDRALRHYFRLVGDDGRRDLPECRIEKRETGPASELEASKLGTRPGAKVVRFLRLRGFDGVPIICERLVLAGSRFPDLVANPSADLPPLVYGHYSKQYGIIVTEAIEQIRAVGANATDSRLLGVPLREPLLEIDRVAMDITQRPVEWRLSHCDTRHHHYLNRFS